EADVQEVVVCGVCFFFFSSRRRHTRLVSDWSSDVCSSDLFLTGPRRDAIVGDLVEAHHDGRSDAWYWRQAIRAVASAFLAEIRQIGRASCRERVEMSVGGGSCKKRRERRRVETGGQAACAA